MLKVGNSLILEDFTDKGIQQYKCKIMDISNNKLYIDYPINKSTGKIVYPVDGTDFSVHFVSNNESFTFQTTLLGRKMNKIPMLMLSVPEPQYIIKKQRREFVRVDTTVDMAIHPMKSEFIPFLTVSYDLSAGGSAIVVKDAYLLKKNQIVEMWLSLPSLRQKEVSFVNVTGKVVREAVEQHDGNYMLPIEFQDVSELERQKIMRFIFEVQLEQRQKEIAFFDNN